jgi:hypothetical protein
MNWQRRSLYYSVLLLVELPNSELWYASPCVLTEVTVDEPVILEINEKSIVR